VGADGGEGCELITTVPVDPEVHPAAFVTVKVYDPPAGNPDAVKVVPVPVFVIAPGFLVSVHVPDEGKPLNATLPLDTEHVGCVIVPNVGVVAAIGELITTFPDDPDVHPDTVTVYVYVPVASPDMVVLVPVPVVVTLPGDLVNVQVPVAGKSFNTTLPVPTVHVGWVIVPIVGAEGADDAAVITTSPVAPEVQAYTDTVKL